MARPRRLPPPPPRLPALRRGARRAPRGATRRRRRLRLEHVRVAGGGRVVSAARRSVRPPRRVERARRAPGLAADGEERSRPDRRGRRSRGTGRRVARPRCDARPRRRRRPDPVVANTIDVARFVRDADCSRRAAPSFARSRASAPDDVAVLSVARLAPEKGLDTLVRAVAEAADPASSSRWRDPAPSGSVSRPSPRRRVSGSSSCPRSRGSGSSSATSPPTSSRSSRGTSPGASS